MELKEALVELGLDPADRHDEATVRRAYLKGVKVRKPETDPEGFRRLREAYELLRVFGPALARHATPDVPAVEVRSESPSPPDLPPPPADGPSVDPLTPYLDRLDALPAQPWLDRLAVAREAFRALPITPASRISCWTSSPPATPGPTRWSPACCRWCRKAIRPAAGCC